VNDAAPPYLRDELDARSLHFSMSAIQSRMEIRRPDALMLEYTRLAIAWLMWRPAATRLAMIGLGGGSIAKFCHRHLPHTTMVVVEIDPRVIALRTAFRVPADDARLRVVEGDGARFVAETGARFDVLLVDAFDAAGMPAALGTQRFYDDCVDALAPAGMLVANLHAGHPQLGLHLERIARSFGAGVLRVDDHDGANAVVFAARSGCLPHAGSGGALRRPAPLAEAPWQELRSAFARVASAWQRDQAKAIAPSSTRP
jgi:spermidine synthase